VANHHHCRRVKWLLEFLLVREVERGGGVSAIFSEYIKAGVGAVYETIIAITVVLVIVMRYLPGPTNGANCKPRKAAHVLASRIPSF
jgi:hypothetical protein